MRKFNFDNLAIAADNQGELFASFADITIFLPSYNLSFAAPQPVPSRAEPFVINGTNGDDFLIGTSADDIINGLSGNDTLQGGAGSNMLFGGAGDDVFIGGTGADVLDGGEGVDTATYASSLAAITYDGLGLVTAAGDVADDTLTSIEIVIGTDFSDRFYGDGLESTFFGGDGADILYGRNGNDWLSGGAGNDTLIGGDDDDTLMGGSGGDTLNGGAGIDTVLYTEETSGAVIDLLNGTASGSAMGDSFVDVENLTGSGFDDVIRANDIANIVIGGLGHDLLEGRAGDDVLRGGEGNDDLRGGDDVDMLDGGIGDDSLMGGSGDDVIEGGDGLDVAIYNSANSANYIVIRTDTGAYTVESIGGSNEGLDTLTGIETIRLGGINGTDYAINALSDSQGTGTQIETITYPFSGGNGTIITADLRALNFDNAGELFVISGSDGGATDTLHVSINGSQLQDIYRLDIDVLDALDIYFTGAADTLDLSFIDMPEATVFGTTVDETLIVDDEAFSFHGGAGSDTLILRYDSAAFWNFTAHENENDAGHDLIDFSQLSVTLSDFGNVLGRLEFDLPNGRITQFGQSLPENSYADVTHFETYSGWEGSDVFIGDARANIFRGNGGDDTVIYNDSSEFYKVVSIDGGYTVEAIGGIDAGSGIDTLYDIGLIGFGAATNAFVSYRSLLSQSNLYGDLTLALTHDNDTYSAGSNEGVTALDGDDVITVTGGDTIVYGGNGDDILVETGTAGGVTLNGGSGNDTLTVQGPGSVATAGAGDNVITLLGDGTSAIGGSGNDLFIIRPETENAAMDIQGGDRLIYDSSVITGAENKIGGTFNITTNETAGAYNNITISFIGALTMVGGGFTDILTGGNGDDDLHGGEVYIDGGTAFESADSLYGMGGDDSLNGGGGADTLDGGSGDDVLIGGSDSTNSPNDDDTLIGGDGIDIAVYASANAADYIITETAPGEYTVQAVGGTHEGMDTLTGIELLRLGGINGTDFNIANLVTGAGPFDVSLTNLDDDFTGTLADDTVNGLDGNDIIRGEAGVDNLLGGLGNDIIYGGDANDVIHGESGNDTLYGDDGDDVIFGGAGNDTHYGGAGNDLFRDGAGVDSFFGNTGSFSNDTVSYEGFTLALTADLATNINTGLAAGDSYSSIENITGSDGENTLRGDAQRNTLIGGDSADIIWGRNGNDILIGNGGNDTILGGRGGDTLFGGAGDDYLDAEGGRAVYASADLSDYIITYNRDIDTYTVEAIGGTNEGIDTVLGVSWLRFGGLDGIDYDVDDIAIGAPINLFSFDNDYTGTADDELINGYFTADIIRGEGGEDIINGDRGDDILFGGTGNDILNGGLDDDSLYGDDGDDILNGESGDDVLFGGAGSDILNGGDGVDTASYEGLTGDLFVDLFTGEGTGLAAGDSFISIENLTGAASRSLLNGDNADNFLTGGGANDTLRGREGNDTLRGEGGTDYLTGGDGDDLIFGGLGDDTILGDAGNDMIEGGGGGDEIYGDDGDDIINSGDGADSVFGGEGVDIIDGGEGDDVIFGQAGDDAIFGGVGGTDIAVYLSASSSDYTVTYLGGMTYRIESLSGTEGTDILTDIEMIRLGGVNGADYLITDLAMGSGFISLTNGDDIYSGTSADEVINGLDGNDIIDGGVGNNTLNGDAGNDTLISFGNDNLNGGTGDDLVELGGNVFDAATTTDGGADIDTISFSTLAQLPSGNLFLVVDLQGQAYSVRDGSSVLYVDPFTSFENATGSEHRDLLQGDSTANTLSGLSGNDTLQGRGGDDILNGGSGDNTLQGGDGQDQIFSLGNDIIDAGEGNDFVEIGESVMDSATAIAGGSGIDTLSLTRYIGNTAAINFIVVDLQSQAFSIRENGAIVHVEQISGFENATGTDYTDLLQGDGAANWLTGLDGDDTLQGRGGDDILLGGDGDDILEGGAGADILDGGFGTDIASYAFAASAIVYDGLGLVTASGDIADDTLLSIEAIRGTDFSDSLFGANDASIFYGGAGADRLFGRNGDDELYGEDGDDIILGGRDNDLIDGGAGNDQLRGNEGDDTLLGGDGNDVLAGGAGADVMDGGAGIDRVEYTYGTNAGVTASLGNSAINTGDAAGDTYINIENLYGTTFMDTLYGDAGNNRIDGRLGDDMLFGGDGNDYLIGGAGNDVMNGEGGNDLLLGQAGADIYQFDAAHGTDRIVVFTQGEDLIEFTEGVFDFSGLTITQDGAHVNIVSSEGTIIANNSLAADFTADDFIFAPPPAQDPLDLPLDIMEQDMAVFAEIDVLV